MKLLSPQPNQTFFHVGPDGNSYGSGEDRVINPLTADDANALRALGCVDVVEVAVFVEPDEEAEVTVTEPFALASIDEVEDLT